MRMIAIAAPTTPTPPRWKLLRWRPDTRSIVRIGDAECHIRSDETYSDWIFPVGLEHPVMDRYRVVPIRQHQSRRFSMAGIQRSKQVGLGSAVGSPCSRGMPVSGSTRNVVTSCER